MMISMKKLHYFLLTTCLIFTCTFTSACSKNPEPVSKTGYYFDTIVTITLYCQNADAYIDDCFDMAEKYENLFSATKEGTDIYNLNHNNGEALTLDSETIDLITAGIQYAKDSNGAFDLSVGELSSLGKLASKQKNFRKKMLLKKHFIRFPGTT